MKKYDIVLVDLNPRHGSEQSGVRPCIVLQNNLVNASRLQTVTIAPLTSKIKYHTFALIVNPSATNNLEGQSRIEFTQICTIDQDRIVHVLGSLDKKYQAEVKEKLMLFFDMDDEF